MNSKKHIFKIESLSGGGLFSTIENGSGIEQPVSADCTLDQCFYIGKYLWSPIMMRTGNFALVSLLSSVYPLIFHLYME